jgi:hypothetical protein
MAERNGLATVFALCAVAMGALLLTHPAGSAGSFADMVKAEASHQLRDALVHGGFMVTECVLMVGFTIWSRLLGANRVPVVVGMVAFCVGAGALLASMILDGFVSPALAIRFGGDLDTARVLLSFCGTVIRFLMPMGLALQCVAILSWSSVLLGSTGVTRGVGMVGVVFAVAVPLLALAFMNLSAHLILGAIVVQVMWYLGLAVALAYGGKALSRSV